MVRLAHEVAGSGPLLVLVHGAAADADSFRLLQPILAQRFTTVTVDRRGRRASADEASYSIDAEFDDLAALIDSFGRRAAVFGHSFGGNVALGAALRTSNVSSLVVYEPGFRGDMAAETLAEFMRLDAEEDRAGLLALALREFAGFPAEHVDELLEVPVWRERLAYAHTIVRELRAYHEFDERRLLELDAPTLLLVGGDSSDADREHAAQLAARLPRGSAGTLAGHGHTAPFTGPAPLAEAIARFVGDGR